MFTVFLIFFIGMIVSSIIFGLHIYQQSEELRPHRLLRHSQARGYGFEENGNKELLNWNERSPLFQSGENRNIINVVYGPYRDIEFTLFDYRFQHGEQTYSTSVIAIDLKNKGLPRFSLWPRINMPTDSILEPEQDCIPLNLDGTGKSSQMQNHYQLHTANEGTARLLFCPKATDYLVSNTNFFIEGSGNWIILYKFNQRCQPTKIENFLHSSYQILRALRLNDSRVNFEPELDINESSVPIDQSTTA